MKTTRSAAAHSRASRASSALARAETVRLMTASALGEHAARTTVSSVTERAWQWRLRELARVQLAALDAEGRDREARHGA
jgi:hypothetical protein